MGWEWKEGQGCLGGGAPLYWYIFYSIYLCPIGMLGLKRIARTFPFVERQQFATRKDSHWIYSSQSEQMAHARQGTLTLSVLPEVAQDTTIRLHKAIRKSHLLLAATPSKVSTLMRGLQSTLAPTQPEGQIVLSSNQLVRSKSEGQTQMDESLELSKHLEFSLENQKIDQSNNDRDYSHLKKQQDRLVQFMEMTKFKQNLQDFKKRNQDWPHVQPLRASISRLQEWRGAGINVLCLLDESQPFESRQLLKALETQLQPYEILPTPNSIVSALAGSGFPADRFAIEYYPETFSFLSTRASMKMAIGVILEGTSASTLLRQIVKSYGPSHNVYVENSRGDILGRGEAKQVLQQVAGHEKATSSVRVVVAPYLSAFNPQLREEKDRASQLVGQVLRQDTHFVQVQFLAKQLESLGKSRSEKEVMYYSLFERMLSKGIPNDIAAQIVAEMSPCQSQAASRMAKQVKEGLERDHIGLAQLAGKK